MKPRIKLKSVEIPVFKKIETIAKTTEDNIRSLTMSDLEKIINSMSEQDGKLMLNAIKELKFHKIGHIFEYLTYRAMQGKIE